MSDIVPSLSSWVYNAYMINRLGYLLVAMLLVGSFMPSLAIAHTEHGDGGASISAFVRDDCKHCIDFKEFVEAELKVEHPGIEVTYYDLENERYQELFIGVAEHYELVKATPIILVGDQIIQGFGSAQTTGKLINRIVTGYQGEPLSILEIKGGGAEVANEFSADSSCDDECALDGDFHPSYEIDLPFTSKTVDVGKFSLSIMALLLGLVDGFNPCALWVLLMFLMILTQVGSRRRMFEYAGIFILAQAIMYYLILNVWLTAWDFIGLNRIVTPLIGLLALGSGIYFLYKFATYKATCTVTDEEEKESISNRITALAKKPMSWAVFFGILGIAFSVNIFEFACSIGIPQTFTKILELNNLTGLETQGYIGLYMLMYMIDDIFIFALGLWGLHKMGAAHKYAKWATLLGGLMMILLGVLMLFRPDLLVF